jgi:hypothetical protein
MGHELMGRMHAAMVRERGQGTVEYVGLIMLLAVVLAAVVAAAGKTDAGGIAEAVVSKIKGALDTASASDGKNP